MSGCMVYTAYSYYITILYNKYNKLNFNKSHYITKSKCSVLYIIYFIKYMCIRSNINESFHS